MEKKNWGLQEIVLKPKPSRKLVQKHYRQNLEYYFKFYCEITVLLKMIEDAHLSIDLCKYVLVRSTV